MPAGRHSNIWLQALLARPGSLTTQQIMLLVAAAMLPALAVRLYYFGSGLWIDLAVGLTLTLACDRLVQGRDFWLQDLSSLVALLILLLALPPAAPPYVLAFALLAGLLMGKYAFGGLGQNIFNPAMVGYACALLALPWEFNGWLATSWEDKLGGVDALSSATVLESSQRGLVGARLEGYHYSFAVALTCGYVLLLYYRVASARIAFSFLASLSACSALGWALGWSAASPLEHLLGGGTLLAAFFVVTDPVTAPSQLKRQLLYGATIAALSYGIRVWGSYPDGIAFAILLANALFL